MQESEKLTLIIERAKKGIVPTEKETSHLRHTAEKVSGLLHESFSKAPTVPEIALGGSYAKGTWLKGSGDIDFYLLYPVSYPRQMLETEAIEISLKAVAGYPIRMRFAEHPYVECFVDSVRVNIVPCYKVPRGEWQSAADRSPFHAEYIRSHFDDALRDETRVLKKFVKTLNLYGAEVKTQGLSGYVCEVLTLKFGSFLSAIEGVANLKENEVISVESYDKDLAALFKSRVVILDPIDTTRNLGMAISPANLAKLILACRSFLDRPSSAYFNGSVKRKKGKAASTKKGKELLEKTLVISFKTRQRSVDILWGQLAKSLNAIVQLLEFYGFEVLRSNAASNETSESAFIVLLGERKLSDFKVRTGPDVFRRSDVEAFIKKNKDRAILSWIDSDGKVNFLFEREKSLAEAKTALMKSLSDRAKLASIGLAKEVTPEIARGFTISYGTFILRKKHPRRAWLAQDVESVVTGELA